MVGRLADAIVLSAEERGFLEAQVRRQKAARSLSDRCRMILLCANGLQSKQVAERLGVHEHTVGKWRRCQSRSKMVKCTVGIIPSWFDVARALAGVLPQPMVLLLKLLETLELSPAHPAILLAPTIV